MYYLETGYQKHTRFRNAVVLALAFHAGVIFSVSFDSRGARYKAPQIEVTLATQPAREARGPQSRDPGGATAGGRAARSTAPARAW